MIFAGTVISGLEALLAGVLFVLTYSVPWRQRKWRFYNANFFCRFVFMIAALETWLSASEMREKKLRVEFAERQNHWGPESRSFESFSGEMRAQITRKTVELSFLFVPMLGVAALMLRSEKLRAASAKMEDSK